MSMSAAEGHETPSSMDAQVSTLRDFLADVAGKEGQVETDNSFDGEFLRLKRQSTKIKTEKLYPSKAAERTENVKKNRYKDIVPFDHSRVKLTLNVRTDGTDYINASFIKGVSGQQAYIATQGPLPHTVLDMWQMLWQYEVQVVVMACREFEMARKKCERYWPASMGDVFVCEPFTVTLLSEEDKGDYLTRTLNVTYQHVSRPIKHLQYMNWPDHGVPDSIPSILELLQEMRGYQDHENIPICIHCSAGCGRTGVLCAIDFVWNLLKRQNIPKSFSVFKLVQEMRTQRPSLVQTKEQYALVYRAIAFLFERHLEAISLSSGQGEDEVHPPSPTTSDLISDLSSSEPEEDLGLVDSKELSNSMYSQDMAGLEPHPLLLPLPLEPDMESPSAHRPQGLLDDQTDKYRHQPCPSRPAIHTYTQDTPIQGISQSGCSHPTSHDVSVPKQPRDIDSQHHAKMAASPQPTSPSGGVRHQMPDFNESLHQSLSTHTRDFDPIELAHTPNYEPATREYSPVVAHTHYTHKQMRSNMPYTQSTGYIASSNDQPPGAAPLAYNTDSRGHSHTHTHQSQHASHTPPSTQMASPRARTLPPPLVQVSHVQRRVKGAHASTTKQTPHTQEDVNSSVTALPQRPRDHCVTVEDPYFSPLSSPLTGEGGAEDWKGQSPGHNLNQQSWCQPSSQRHTVVVSEDEDAPSLPERTPESFIFPSRGDLQQLITTSAKQIGSNCRSLTPPLPERTPESFIVPTEEEMARFSMTLLSPQASESTGSPPSPVPPLPQRTPESFELPVLDVSGLLSTSGHKRRSLLCLNEVHLRGESHTGRRPPRCVSAIMLPGDRSLALPLEISIDGGDDGVGGGGGNARPLTDQGLQRHGSPHIPCQSDSLLLPQPSGGNTSSGAVRPQAHVGISSEWAGLSQPRTQDAFMTRSKSVKIRSTRPTTLSVAADQGPVSPNDEGTPAEGAVAVDPPKQLELGASGSPDREDHGKPMTRKKSWRRFMPKSKTKEAPPPAPLPPPYGLTSGFRFIFGHRFGKPKGPRSRPETWV